MCCIKCSLTSTFTSSFENVLRPGHDWHCQQTCNTRCQLPCVARVVGKALWLISEGLHTQTGRHLTLHGQHGESFVSQGLADYRVASPNSGSSHAESAGTTAVTQHTVTEGWWVSTNAQTCQGMSLQGVSMKVTQGGTEGGKGGVCEHGAEYGPVFAYARKLSAQGFSERNAQFSLIRLFSYTCKLSLAAVVCTACSLSCVGYKQGAQACSDNTTPEELLRVLRGGRVL